MLPVNDTPFVLERFAIFSKEGAETLVVLLKGTFELAHAQPPVIAKEQEPIADSDTYSGEPGKSGILLESDRVPPKPGTGVTLRAHALPGHSDGRSAHVRLHVDQL